jgi:hypothetical protein
MAGAIKDCRKLRYRLRPSLRGNAVDATNGLSARPLNYNATLVAFRAKELERQVSFGHLSSDPKEQFDVIARNRYFAAASGSPGSSARL